MSVWLPEALDTARGGDLSDLIEVGWQLSWR